MMMLNQLLMLISILKSIWLKITTVDGYLKPDFPYCKNINSTDYSKTLTKMLFGTIFTHFCSKLKFDIFCPNYSKLLFLKKRFLTLCMFSQIAPHICNYSLYCETNATQKSHSRRCWCFYLSDTHKNTYF